jgi:small-conductance mechanosensitive channel
MTQLIEATVGISPAIQEKILWSLAVTGILVFCRHLFLRLLWKRTDDVRFYYRTRKSSAYIAVVLSFLVIGRIWFDAFEGAGTYLGLLSAGLAIALKDLVASVAGWLYLLWRRPFEVGDRIQIGSHSGDVIDIRLFRFTLMEIGNWVEADQSTGRVIHVPNSRVLTEVIANYNKGFEHIWNELPVLVTFESNWTKAKSILQQIADRHALEHSKTAAEALRMAAKKSMIVYTTLTPRVWTSVADSGILLTVRYLCNPRQRRGTAEMIWEDVLRQFDSCADIDFAYPTVRRFINPDEGKSGTGGPGPRMPGELALKTQGEEVR